MKSERQRWLALLCLAAALCIGAAACGDDDDEAGSEPASSAAPASSEAAATTAASAPAESSAAETGAPEASEPATSEAAETTEAAASEPAADLPTDPVEIRMDWWGETEAPGAEKWLKAAMDAYSAAHPNVTFESNLVATRTLIPQQEATCKAKEGPTIQYMWGGIYTLNPAWQDCIVPISDLVGEEEASHYVAREEVTYDGKTWAAAWYGVPSYPVIYNKAVFEKVGVDPATAFADYDSLLAACDTFAAAGTPLFGVGGKDQAGIGYFHEDFVGDAITSVDLLKMVTGETSFSDPAWVDINAQILELNDHKCFPEDFLSLEVGPAHERVLSGQAGAAVITGSAVAGFADQLGDDAGVALLPTRGTGPNKGSLAMTSQTLGITSFASDDQKAVAADFIKFLHSPEQLQAFYDATGVPPADDRFDVSSITSPALAQVYDWAYNPGRALVSNFLPNPPLNQNEPVLAVLSGQLDSAQAAADNLQDQAEQWRKANQLLVERYQTLLETQEALAG